MHVELTPKLYASLLRIAALASAVLEEGEHDKTCKEEWREGFEHILSRANLFGHGDAVEYDRKQDLYRVKEDYLESDAVVDHALTTYADALGEEAICTYVTKYIAGDICLPKGKKVSDEEVDAAMNEAGDLVEESYKKSGIAGVLLLLFSRAFNEHEGS